MDKLMQEPQSRKEVLENFLASSRLDGYEADSKLTEKQLKKIASHEGSDEELRDQLLGVYGGASK